MKGKILTLLALLLVGNFVAASPFEWIESFTITGSGSGCVTSAGSNVTLSSIGSCSFTANMGLQGTSNWLENAAFYYKPAAGGDWAYLSKVGGGECKTQLNLNGGITVVYSCNFVKPAAGNYVFRASINFNGCGGWTPTPNTATCGDTRDLNVFSQ